MVHIEFSLQTRSRQIAMPAIAAHMHVMQQSTHFRCVEVFLFCHGLRGTGNDHDEMVTLCRLLCVQALFPDRQRSLRVYANGRVCVG